MVSIVDAPVCYLQSSLQYPVCCVPGAPGVLRHALQHNPGGSGQDEWAARGWGVPGCKLKPPIISTCEVLRTSSLFIQKQLHKDDDDDDDDDNDDDDVCIDIYYT